MLSITKEEYEKLYKFQKNGLKIFNYISFAILIVSIPLLLISNTFVTGYTKIVVLGVIFLINALLMIATTIFRHKVIPKEYSSPNIQTAANLLRKDMTSDAMLSGCMQMLQNAVNFEEQATMIGHLACIFAIRGQHADAIQVMRRIDYSQFESHPRLAMRYFGDLIEIYSAMGDQQSVLAVYADAEPFIRKCYKTNYINCSCAVATLVYVHKAKGEYQKALEYQLMKTELEDDMFRKSAQNPTQLQQYLAGDRYCTLAELYCLCGDYKNAKLMLDKGGPLIGITPYLVSYANGIAEKIQKNG